MPPRSAIQESPDVKIKLTVSRETSRYLDTPAIKVTSAFTLVELLVVMVIGLILMALVVPAMNAFKGAGDVTRAAYDVQGALQTARTYAMANNTYTWVGFFEEDISQVNQVPAVSGTGRLDIVIVASKNGTPVYSTQSAYISTSGTATQTQSLNQILDANNQIQLALVGKPIKLDNIHLAQAPAFGGRPMPSATGSFVGAQAHTPIFTFQYPLTGTAQYTFGSTSATGTGTIQFSPQGQAIYDLTTALNTYEISLQSTHGTSVGAVSTAPNLVAIDIFGLSGQSKIYRQ